MEKEQIKKAISERRNETKKKGEKHLKKRNVHERKAEHNWVIHCLCSSGTDEAYDEYNVCPGCETSEGVDDDYKWVKCKKCPRQ